MSILGFLALALFSWRLAYMLVKEDGPGNVFGYLRRIIGVREKLPGEANGRATFYGLNPVADALTCVYCTSVWTAALGWGLLQTPAAPLVYILAGSGLALMAHRYVGFD